MLDPRQLSTLTEMGIPVWELRKAENATPIREAASAEIYEPIPAVDYLIVLAEQDNHQQAKRLLQAMLFSIGLTSDNAAIVLANQLHQLSETVDLAKQHKLLIAFGDDLVPETLNSQKMLRGHIYSAHNLPLKMMTSFSLTTLLNAPDKKALAWQDLQLFKANY